MKIAILIWILIGMGAFARVILNRGILRIEDIVLSPLCFIIGPIVLLAEFLDNIDTVVWRRK